MAYREPPVPDRDMELDDRERGRREDCEGCCADNCRGCDMWTELDDEEEELL